MKKYSSVVIYRKSETGEFMEQDSMNFLDSDNADIAHSAVVCQLSKKLSISIKYNNVVQVGKYFVKLVKNLPIVYYLIDSKTQDVLKVSFSLDYIKQEQNIKNHLGENCCIDQYPRYFEDSL